MRTKKEIADQPIYPELQPAWQDVPEDLAHVSRIDSHPSPLVHAMIAEYLVNTFRERGWLSQP